MRTAVIIPAYNEELTIRSVIEAFQREIPEAQLVVVNNNSHDKTREIAQQTFAELGANGVILDESRQGKGNAVRLAFTKVEADVYVIVDADMTYPADAVRKLIQPILEKNADVVVGNRHFGGRYKEENKRIMHNFGNSLVKWVINSLFRANLSDIMSGYRAFNRRFVKSYPILVEGFQIETDMTLHALDKRFRIVEVPIDYRDRPAGSVSKLNTFADGMRVLFTIAQILRYYRPLMFFGWLSAFVGLAGLIAGAPAVLDFIMYHWVYHVPLAILASSLEIVALVLFAIGLILDTVVKLHKLEFETLLLRFGKN